MVSLDKVAAEAPHLVNLFKQVGVSLEKAGIDPSRFPATLQVKLDRSLSTKQYGLYDEKRSQQSWSDDPTILQAAVLAFVAALRFDPRPDPAMPAAFFGQQIEDLGMVTLANSSGFLAQKNRQYGFGNTTNYRQALRAITRTAGFGNIDLDPGWITESPASPAPVVQSAPKRSGWRAFLGLDEPPAPTPAHPPVRRTRAPFCVKATTKIPNLAFFFTDGEPKDDPEGIRQELRLMSQVGTFVQFIGVGPADFSFLEE